MNQENPSKRRSVLVTGATGFVGEPLCQLLSSKGWQVRRAVRRAAKQGDIEVGDFGTCQEWRQAVEGVDCIVHLAARTHFINEKGLDSIDAYRSINVRGTMNLARAAILYGVRRFVFVSSIKVNGEHTMEKPFNEQDEPRPLDAYGISKSEAETALQEIAGDGKLEITILRPPLVYGPGAKANFLRLLHLCRRRTPVPFASIKNRRSLIYVGNLLDAISACLDHPMAAGKTYLVGDIESVSTPELVRMISAALGVRPRLFPFPVSLMGKSASMLGHKPSWDRLAGSLELDSARIRRELAWRPPFTMAEGLAETARWYYSQFPMN